MLGQLRLHPVRVGGRKVTLVDRHDHRHAGSLHVAYRLDRLWHDSVVSGHHQDGDVGDVGAAGPHGGKCRVARSVDKRDRLPSGFGLVGADVLGDAPGFTLGDLGLADCVEKARLAVVGVAEDRHDRRAVDQRRGVILECLLGINLRRGNRRGPCLLGLKTQVEGDCRGGIVVNRLVLCGHDPVGHEPFDNFDRRNPGQVAQFLHGQGRWNGDCPGSRRWFCSHRQSIPSAGSPRPKPVSASRSSGARLVRSAYPMLPPLSPFSQHDRFAWR